MKYEDFTVKIKEEELPDSYCIISVPEEKLNDFKSDFEMGTKYAQAYCMDDNPEEYDEYFNEMVDIRKNCNGEKTFIEYMTAKGYDVKPFKFDLEFSW